MCTRVSQLYQIYDFSTFTKLGKIIYLKKSCNKQFFADPAEIELSVKIVR